MRDYLYEDIERELDEDFNYIASGSKSGINKALRDIKKKQTPDLLDSMCSYEDDSYEFFDKDYMGEEW